MSTIEFSLHKTSHNTTCFLSQLREVKEQFEFELAQRHSTKQTIPSSFFTEHTFPEFKHQQHTIHHATSNSFFHTSCEKCRNETAIRDIKSIPQCFRLFTKCNETPTSILGTTKEQEHTCYSATATADSKTTTPTAFERTNLLIILVGSHSHGRIWFHGQLHYDNSRKRH